MNHMQVVMRNARYLRETNHQVLSHEQLVRLPLNSLYKKIVDLNEQGYSRADIHKMTGSSQRTIRRALSDF